MNPVLMLTIIVALSAAFAYSANRRWQLLKVGRSVNRLDRPFERLMGVWRYSLRQTKMRYYPLAGLAHKFVFLGFVALLLRTLILWGRGFDPTFSLWILGDEPVHLPVLGAVGLGHAYEFVKEITATLTVFGVLVFVYYRVVVRMPRMTLSGEGLLILGIIGTMMIADMIYDGASIAIYRHHAGLTCAAADASLCERIAKLTAHFGTATVEAPGWHLYPDPAGSFFAMLFDGLGATALSIIALAGFWTHSTLVLVILNLLPHSKHFHIITAVPNSFTRDLDPPGRLAPVAESAEKIGEMVMAAAEEPDNAPPVGVSRIEHFTWKAILDFYTCTECGRCSDNCPAHKSGKILSPKQLTLDLRDHLYARESEFLNRPGGPRGIVEEAHAHAPPDGEQKDGEAHADGHEGGDHDHDDHGHDKPMPDNPVPVPEVESKPIDLIGNVVHPDVLWACTTCRACEEQCPVMISYVDKIVGMRRHLVMVKGEFPAELGNPFQAMEVNGNPWNLARIDRANWAEGLDVPTMADNPKAAVLYWVGCAASYDDRAKKIARATAKLLQAAGVDFAILGHEETCTGDPARRAGNEYLFAQLAEQNAATLNGYKEQGGIRQIVTTCPHCMNTLKNEYPDFGARFEVVNHTDFLLGLVAEKKLVPKKAVKGTVTFHDSCYLGRYNGIYDSPRDILRAIPGVTLVEPEGWNREKGLCCGAGGAQMWMEEQNKDRMNVKRTLQLLQTEAKTIATACPFCQTMITDGLKAQSKEDEVRQLDVVELLEESCSLDKKAKAEATQDAAASA